MAMADYAPPLDQLLTHGPIKNSAEGDWPDYVTLFRLGPDQIPELIRMATDHELRWSEEPGYYENSVAYWAPVYAWRALGQLRAAAASASLLAVLAEPDDEWAASDLPAVYALIGSPALPALTAYLDDHTHEMYARAVVLTALTRLAQAQPAARAAGIAVLLQQLAHALTDDPTFSGFIIGELTDLQATEALPAIEQAFAADKVDITITDWPTTQFEFGLISEAEMQRRSGEFTARRRAALAAMSPGLVPFLGPVPVAARPRKSTPNPAKAKRKQAAHSRKKNRKQP